MGDKEVSKGQPNEEARDKAPQPPQLLNDDQLDEVAGGTRPIKPIIIVGG